jgi:hypothetical protein
VKRVLGVRELPAVIKGCAKIRRGDEQFRTLFVAQLAHCGSQSSLGLIVFTGSDELLPSLNGNVRRFAGLQKEPARERDLNKNCHDPKGSSRPCCHSYLFLSAFDLRTEWSKTGGQYQ